MFLTFCWLHIGIYLSKYVVMSKQIPLRIINPAKVISIQLRLLSVDVLETRDVVT